MGKSKNPVQNRREELRGQYGAAYQKVRKMLFDADPHGIGVEAGTDEYEVEVDTILPRLQNCESIDDARRVVHEEFVRWSDADSAGPPEKYHAVAKRIWEEVLPVFAK